MSSGSAWNKVDIPGFSVLARSASGTTDRGQIVLKLLTLARLQGNFAKPGWRSDPQHDLPASKIRSNALVLP
jgi:hypothetical protein